MPVPARGGSSPADDLSDGEALRRMYRITADYERPYEDKLRDLLELGRAYLGVETGFLTRIDDETQVIVESVGEHAGLQSGRSCPLSKAYCRRTLQREDALTLQHAAVEGWEGDAAYEEFGLESYIGAKVVVAGEIYGTFCFADSEPRDRPFTDAEVTFVELMAEWVSYERFQAEATETIQRQRDRLAEFSSVVSHDLRNPLNVVQGYLDLAEETGDPAHFERCRAALSRMDALIGDLLVLAQEGSVIDETAPVDIPEVAHEAWLVVDTDDASLVVDADLTVTADEGRLQQLFENLYRNAVEHGGAAVTVTVDDLPAESGFLVEDDGAGIPESERERVFEEGFSTGTDGTGFGLSIVEQIVDAHGWRIELAEGTAGGARFEIHGVETVPESG